MTIDLRRGSGTYATPTQVADEVDHEQIRASVYADLSYKRSGVVVRDDDIDSSTYTVVYPLTKARNIVFGAAVVNDWIGDAGKMTLAQLIEIQGWNAELQLHSRTHPSGDSFDFTDEFIDAADDLRALNMYIASLVQPGGTTNARYFDTLAKLETPEGAQIRAAFASFEAYYNPQVANYISPLPVQRRYGTGAVLTMETASLATLTGAVDNAIKYGGLAHLMGHSRYFDQPGYLTIADFTTLLDHIAAKRDAGLIDVLTPTGAKYAQKRAEPVNLLADPSFDESATGAFRFWEATGSPTVGVDGRTTNYVSIPDTSNHVSQYIRAEGVRSLRVKGYCRSGTLNTPTTARMVLRMAEVVSGTSYVDHDVTLGSVGNDWTPFETVVGADPRANILRLWLYHNGGGLPAVQWSDLEVWKV